MYHTFIDKLALYKIPETLLSLSWTLEDSEINEPACCHLIFGKGSASLKLIIFKTNKYGLQS